MIRHIRIHNTSDGGTLDIGASAKTIIEVNGAKISLLDIIQLSMLSLAEVVKVDGLTTVISHRCPESEKKSSFDERAEDSWESASERAYKES